MRSSLKLIFLVFLVALTLRLYKLNEFPVGFHADEVRVGWNALSILETGKDDRGNKFALYYNTFGDFRPTGIFYLTIPSIGVFGRNEFAVRFPPALLGALSVISLYFFVSYLTKNKSLALFSAFLLAISPWHLTTSRATSEVVMSLALTLTGLFLFLKGLNAKSKKLIILSGITFSISYFFYHSVRILTPLFVLTLIVYFARKIKEANLT
ncbi:MAG: glycosyltransferase family 39 protein, partial [Patescibacteria group bacterium]